MSRNDTSEQVFDQSSDEELMTLYAQGSTAAFQQLYSRYEAKLYGFLRRRLSGKHQSAADDLFQLTWLKAHKNRKTFDPQHKFSSWIYTIALNSLRDYSKLIRHEIERGGVEDQAEKVSEANETSQEQELLNKEILNKVNEVLEELPQVQRDILILSDWEGFDSKAIAKMLKVSDGAVRQKLLRARRFSLPSRRPIKLHCQFTICRDDESRRLSTNT